MGRDGRDGIDGKAGKDGKSVDPAAVERLIAKAVEQAVRGIPPPRAGRDGKDGVDGKAVALGVLRVEVIREEFHIPGIGMVPLATELVIRPEGS